MNSSKAFEASVSSSLVEDWSSGMLDKQAGSSDGGWLSVGTTMWS